MCTGRSSTAQNSAKSLGVSHHTVRSYMDLLEQTYIVETLRPSART